RERNQLLDLPRWLAAPRAGDQRRPDRDHRVLALRHGAVAVDADDHHENQHDPGDLPVLHGEAGHVVGGPDDLLFVVMLRHLTRPSYGFRVQGSGCWMAGYLREGGDRVSTFQHQVTRILNPEP